MNRFAWHPDATLLETDGRRVRSAGENAGLLAALFAAAARGEDFCLTPTGLEITAPSAPDDPRPMFQCLTSGTGGPPKRIRRSQASWLASITRNRDLFQIGPGTRIAVPGALTSSLSLYAAVEGLCLGACVLLLHGLRPDRQLDRIARAPIDILYATPAQIRQFAAAAEARGKPPNSGTRQLVIGGGRFDPAARAAAGRLFPDAALTEFYGAAETSFIALSDATTPEGAVGRAYRGVSIEIRSPDGTPLPPGEDGEIWVSSPYLFEGYVSGASREARRAGDFLTVGEIGRLDSTASLFVSGRRSRMVTIADRNVFLDDVEAMLLEIEGVAQAAVIALPEPRRGHVLFAFATLAGDRAPDTVLATCRERLGPGIAPRRLIALDAWPELPSGKTDYPALHRLCDPGRLRA
jgi:long-chain acyl-CoA synthetase